MDLCLTIGTNEANTEDFSKKKMKRPMLQPYNEILQEKGIGHKLLGIRSVEALVAMDGNEKMKWV